jgi:hypothetical protein
MKRRQFIGTFATLPIVPALLKAQEGPPPLGEPVEKMTAPNWPTINSNHLGFRPRVGSKTLVVRALASTEGIPPARCGGVEIWLHEASSE